MQVGAKPVAGNDVSPDSLVQALGAWREAIGDSRVVTQTAQYNVDTSSFAARIPAALRPACTEQVQDIVRIAQRFSVPIYPVSTGHNWGYGTSVPLRSPGVIVDLSSMNRIIGFDQELGVVTLEPGVTQGALSEYLRSRGLRFMVPVTGAGPSCSIVANALERGFGITPVTDHFGAVISMKAVLPDGEIYESYTRTFNAAGVAQAYKWGAGPYLDGMFSQSNLGIVVDASIMLRARTERSGALFFVMDTNEQVEELTGQIRQLLAAAGQSIGAINVMNRSRVECLLHGSQRISADNGSASLGSGIPMPDGAWFGLGSVYGTKAHYRATCQLIRLCLRGYSRQIRIYTSDDVRRLRWFGALASMFGWPQLNSILDRLDAAIGIVGGLPSTFALPLAYATSGRAEDKTALNPARDGCGLFWYSPVVPLRRGVVAQFIEFAEGICGRHGLVAPITLTTLSPHYYACTIPLFFDRVKANAESAAIGCFEELYEKGLALGFVPYRMGGQFMPGLARSGAAAGALVRTIKYALDANQVLAPGRYSFE